jgi:hypothetical protein
MGYFPNGSAGLDYQDRYYGKYGLGQESQIFGSLLQLRHNGSEQG